MLRHTCSPVFQNKSTCTCRLGINKNLVNACNSGNTVSTGECIPAYLDMGDLFLSHSVTDLFYFIFLGLSWEFHLFYNCIFRGCTMNDLQTEIFLNQCNCMYRARGCYISQGLNLVLLWTLCDWRNWLLLHEKFREGPIVLLHISTRMNIRLLFGALQSIRRMVSLWS